MEDKLPLAELQKRLGDAASVIRVGGQYRHYKGGVYRVVMFAAIEATNELAVIYEPVSGEKVSFMRPLNDWLMAVEWQGKTVSRFVVTEP